MVSKSAAGTSSICDAVAVVVTSGIIRSSGSRLSALGSRLSALGFGKIFDHALEGLA
jgi:hypothetical protein